MSHAHSSTAPEIQEAVDSPLPGLLGIEIAETSPERLVGRLRVRPEICTTGRILHGGAVIALADALGAGTTMAWQAPIRGEDGTLCAVASQTQLMMDPKPGG